MNRFSTVCANDVQFMTNSSMGTLGRCRNTFHISSCSNRARVGSRDKVMHPTKCNIGLRPHHVAVGLLFLGHLTQLRLGELLRVCKLAKWLTRRALGDLAGFGLSLQGAAHAENARRRFEVLPHLLAQLMPPKGARVERWRVSGSLAVRVGCAEPSQEIFHGVALRAGIQAQPTHVF